MADIVVTVDDDHQASINDVADALRARGMKIDEIHSAIGIIIGSIAEGGTAIADVVGVGSVDGQLTFEVPEPGSDIQ